jgi:glucose/mannose-6-phosphate isomerase
MSQATLTNSKVNLDNEAQIMANDPGGMLLALWNLPEQCGEARRIAMEFNPPQDFAKVHTIMVTGLGGSAIGGDLLRVFAAGKARVPVVVNRDYVLPEFVSEQTLVFAVSYSGNTEETLSAYTQARAKQAKIIVLSTGGKLTEMARRDGVPVITIPGGISPRAATGYLFIPTVITLAKLGIMPDVGGELDDMVNTLKTLREQYKPAVPTADNFAKQIAQKLFNKIPLIWGAAGTTEVVATRWKGQINENSKSMAYWNIFPELNHNEIVGFEVPNQLLKQLAVVILRDQADHPRVQKRMDISKTIIRDQVGGITEVSSTGNSALARLFSLTYAADYVSVYLAALYGIDPSPVKMIDYLKNELAKA